MAGEKIGDMRAHPTPERVADIERGDPDGAALFPLQGALSDRRGASRGERRAGYRKSARGSAIAAEKKLTAQHGIGTWTARYVLMRGGFADAAPVGDSALADRAAAAAQVAGTARCTTRSARLMARFAPHRSLATMHLWTYLKEAGLKEAA